MDSSTYVLVTPARNEEEHIKRTIQSVIRQTVLPKKWVIVNDGSTDRTGEIVSRYAARYQFIELLTRQRDGGRNFGSQACATEAGIALLGGVEYEFIGILDADISLPPEYYETIMAKFREIPNLGIAGGAIYDLCFGKFVRQRCWTNSVPGGIQFFHRKTLEDVGGFIPQPKGGHDAVAEAAARMRGWEVRSFPDIAVWHHRRTGTAKQNIFTARFRQGAKEYSLGYHPIFEIVKCLYRIKEPPYAIGGITTMLGYCWAFLHKQERRVPDDVVNYLRGEQLRRLTRFFTKKNEQLPRGVKA